MDIFSKITYRTTGGHWKRPPSVHPAWCLEDHQCTAHDGNPVGEHRRSVTLHRPWGPLVATRIVSASGRRHELEVRLVVPLSRDDDRAHRQAEVFVARLDVLARRVLTSCGGAR